MPLPVAVYAPPSFIVRQLLVDLGLVISANGSTTPWQGQCVAEPSTPDQVITVYETSSEDNGRIMFDGSRVEQRGVQIRVRGGAYQNDGYLKARQVAIVLDQQVRRTTVAVDSVEYMIHSMNRKSDVIYMGEDTPTSRRKVFTINYTVTVSLLAQER